MVIVDLLLFWARAVTPMSISTAKPSNVLASTIFFTVCILRFFELVGLTERYAKTRVYLVAALPRPLICEPPQRDKSFVRTLFRSYAFCYPGVEDSYGCFLPTGCGSTSKQLETSR